jgi:hypothetical protein
MEYEYKTIVIKDLWMKAKTRHWMIPDYPRDGIVPPTIDQVKQMLWEEMQFKAEFENSLIGIILEEIPEGWECVDKYPNISGFNLSISRGPAYEGGAFTKHDAITHVSADSFEFEIRRPSKEDA